MKEIKNNLNNYLIFNKHLGNCGNAYLHSNMKPHYSVYTKDLD